MILITDGKPTHKLDELLKEVEEIKRHGIRIVAVGVTNAVSESAI